MIYLVYGHQLPVIQKTLKTLIAKCLNGEEIDDFNLEKISAKQVNVSEIAFMCRTMSLMSSRKVVVVSEPYFFSNEKEKVSIEKEQNYQDLMDYFASPNDQNDLIFFLESASLNTKTELFKALKKCAQIIEPSPLTENQLLQMGSQLFRKNGAYIDNNALEELVKRCGDDVSKFILEVNKLSLYKKDIKIEDVKILVSLRLEDNAFELVENLIRNKINDALKIYYDLRINKEEPVRLIALLATQFRFLNQVSYLLSENKSYDQIATILKTKSFRVNKTAKSLLMIKSYQIINILNALYKLDYDIKAGNKDPYFGFEMFLINFNTIKNSIF